MTAEARIEHDRARPDGYFGPDSVAWRVLTAPATTLMIAQLTNLLEVPHRDFQAVLLGHDPLFPTNARRQRGWSGRSGTGGRFHDRLRRTVGVPLPMLFGDQRSARECADRLAQYHRPMSGVATDGRPYRAADPDAMLFAAVTIAHAGLRAYEAFAFDGRPPRRLPPGDRDRYFAEMAELAVLMGVPRDRVPVSAAQIAATTARSPPNSPICPAGSGPSCAPRRGCSARTGATTSRPPWPTPP